MFDLGWLIVGAIEGDGYSPARHDISDLGAVTASHPWVMTVAQEIAGVLVVASALWALRPSLALPNRRDALGVWLLAGSLIALDNIGDFFLRLDCRAADAGCTMAKAIASVHGTLHIVIALVAAAMTIAAPFVLARRCDFYLDGATWHDLRSRSACSSLRRLVTYALLDGAAVQGSSKGRPSLWHRVESWSSHFA